MSIYVVYNRTLEKDFAADGRHGFWREYSDEMNRRLLATWAPPSAQRILKTDAFDEACTGGLTPFIHPVRQTTMVIDKEFATLYQAAANAPQLQPSCADVRFLPFATNTFDWVLSTSTLDHFVSTADISVSLRELHRVLRPAGELLLTLDNPVNPFVALRNSMPGSWSQSAGLSSYAVGATWTPWRLRKEVVGCGFELISFTTIGQCPRALAVVLGSMLGTNGRRAVLRFVLACEKLSSLPSRFVTGHFTAIRARKPPSR